MQLNQLIAKYSVPYWILIVVLGVFALANTDFRWFHGLALVLAIGLAVYYVKAKIQG